jgi:hypothetical protein
MMDCVLVFLASAAVVLGWTTGVSSSADNPAPPLRRPSRRILEDYDKDDDLADVARDFDLFAIGPEGTS